ncbi:winged helix-turn-helix domain-containing protein [Cedecea davisae]|uniref:Winged helix-turn-helix domain-containing protein n=1 Tax=Cedecea davisae TaxID=158484 RepID=A0ABS6DBR2_9ENTR|nr:winged helix-turn-helix domain-containing protein [Cedecea davisae]MBU4680517.1 winged helix-turn-helix domain-containing protein [Cedecea davisae]MBU4685009.1 winged helix-turn-helix domain-containing protein [Cedecea davisae]
MNAIYYKFDNFCFRQGRLTCDHKGEVELAPKESAVLNLLLERANSMISKEEIISKVWKGGVVSDESLTRCIYVLRRVLGQTDKKRFIKTVYGKGYRLLSSVKVCTESARESVESAIENHISGSIENCSIALFPFEMENKVASAFLHDQLVEWLQNIKINNNIPIEVVSSSVTRAFEDYSDFLLAIEKSKADYYITGAEINHNGQSIIRVELVRSKDHSVLHREAMKLSDDNHFNYNALCRVISALLSNISKSIAENIRAEMTKQLRSAVSYISQCNSLPELNCEFVSYCYKNVLRSTEGKPRHHHDEQPDIPACDLLH